MTHQQPRHRTRQTRTRQTRTRPGVVAFVVASALVIGGCGSPAEVPLRDVRGPETGLPASTAAPQATVEVVTVGDIVCPSDLEVTQTQCQQQATAELAGSLNPDAVIALGDLQYESGELDEFQRSWASSWGRFDDIIAPVPGNHEYRTDGAAGYVHYFDTGPYYVREIGDWRFYLLDSNCDQIDCDQEAAWLAKDLAANPTTCAAIAMHHPRWSSSTNHGSQEQVNALWAAAVGGGVDVSLAGHDHDYERFAPIDAAGQVVDQSMGGGSGATHFVIGTGGRSQYEIGDLEPGSAFATGEAFGVLDLTLSPTSFGWRFVNIDGETLDSGKQPCG